MTARNSSGEPDYCGPESYSNSSEFNNSTVEIRRVGYQIVAPITVGVGILGNILNLLVLTTRPFLKGGTKVYLTALAISDLSVMITAIPMVVRWNYSQWKTFEAAFYHAHIELLLNNTFIASSVFIVVCLTVERYFSVCLPTKFRHIHTIKIARTATLGCFGVAIIVSVPLTALKAVCLLPPQIDINYKQWYIQENEVITNTIYWNIYLWCSECIVRFGPCLILAVLNILIIRKFRKITAKRKIYREALTKTRNRDLFKCVNDKTYKKALRNKKYQEEKRLITLLRAIVVLFFVTMTPSAILSLSYSEHYERSFGFQVFRAAANNLELANFSLNFYVYFFCSKEFRTSLLQLFTTRSKVEGQKEDLESGDVETAKINNMLKVIKLNDMSDFNSFEYSGRSFSMPT